MATIDDFGDTTEPLNSPVFGGPSGWAAAVRDAITALQSSITGKLAKAGDTMTGVLTLTGQPEPLVIIDGADTAALGVRGNALAAVNPAGTAFARMLVDTPTQAGDATTKYYVDNHAPDFGTPQLPTDANLDLLSGQGFVCVNADANAIANTPGGGWWFILHMDHTNTPTYGCQLALPMTGAHSVLFRVRAGGGWGAWQVVGP